MRLQRIRDYRLAKRVARGVQRYNGVTLSARRVLAQPHFSVVVQGKVAGWIGYERRGRGVYEIAHLSILPRFRRRGLAERATGRVLGIMRRAGGRYVYARVRRSNYAPQRLLRKFAFKRVGGGRNLRLARRL